MKKLRKYILILILCLIAPTFVGCFRLNQETEIAGSQLKAPLIKIYEKSKCISWSEYSYAKGFQIYCDGKMVDSVDAESCFYEFGHLLKDVKEYSFTIKALSTYADVNDSKFSNVVKYNNLQVINYNKSTEVAVGEYEIKNAGFAGGKTICFEVLPQELGVSEYLIYLKSNSTGLNVYTLNNGEIKNSNYLFCSLDEYKLLDEIYTIRIGYRLNGSNYVASNMFYYNPDSFNGFTDKIYTFDGFVYDYYIETLSELKTMIYHSFISRIQDFDIKISKEIINLAECFSGKNFAEQLDLLIYEEGFGSIYETMAYTANNVVGNSLYFTKSKNAIENIYNVKVSYYDVLECDTSITANKNQVLTQQDGEGYWQTVDYKSRTEQYGKDYDNFASDKQFEEMIVTTSEQLYWAVENKVTPKFKDKTCRAYTIYVKAKEVLNDIISDNMTDYEKALSIFDWICLNTIYDYSALNSSSEYTMKNPCYYLEGVFITGNAVCDGFSKAYSLMCNMLGIDSIRIVGTVKTGGSTGGHAWNKVLLDKDGAGEQEEQYYIVDLTWTELNSLYNKEELAHIYFLLGDDDIKNTHTPFERRDKFKNYSGKTSYNYYTSHTFEFLDEEYDMALTKVEEITPLFEYMLANDINNLEVVVDLDLMIGEYEKAKGAYDPNKDISYNVSTGYIYYYTLRDYFNQNVLKPNKFASQYIFLNYSASGIKYNANGDVGLVYTFTQNLLIDEEKEIEQLVNFLSDHKVNGTYTLYINNQMFGKSIGQYVALAEKLFEDALKNKDIQFDFEFVESNNEYGDKATDIATVYNLKVICN